MTRDPCEHYIFTNCNKAFINFHTSQIAGRDILVYVTSSNFSGIPRLLLSIVKEKKIYLMEPPSFSRDREALTLQSGIETRRFVKKVI
jgi:hypothetical protein